MGARQQLAGGGQRAGVTRGQWGGGGLEGRGSGHFRFRSGQKGRPDQFWSGGVFRLGCASGHFRSRLEGRGISDPGWKGRGVSCLGGGFRSFPARCGGRGVSGTLSSARVRPRGKRLAARAARRLLLTDTATAAAPLGAARIMARPPRSAPLLSSPAAARALLEASPRPSAAPPHSPAQSRAGPARQSAPAPPPALPKRLRAPRSLRPIRSGVAWRGGTLGQWRRGLAAAAGSEAGRGRWRPGRAGHVSLQHLCTGARTRGRACLPS